MFREVVDLQDKLKEEPRFSPTLFSMFNSETNLEDEEVWSLVNLWQVRRRTEWPVTFEQSATYVPFDHILSRSTR